MNSESGGSAGRREGNPSAMLAAEEKALATRIKAERDYLGLSQEQVANVLGIPRAAVSAIETGRRKVSSVELGRLASLFGTTPDRLLGAQIESDPTDVQLYRATHALSAHDKAQVLRFAEFLRSAGTPPEVTVADEDYLEESQ